MVKLNHQLYVPDATPDYVPPPGQTIQELLDKSGMDHSEFARRMEYSRNHAVRLISGQVELTAPTALRLERVLGAPAYIWNKLEDQYREFLARRQEQAALQKQLAWLKNFKHINQMITLEWVSPAPDPLGRLCNLLRFFGQNSISSWEQHWQSLGVAFRKSNRIALDRYSLAAWLRQGELLGHQLNCQSFNRHLFLECLNALKPCTTKPPNRLLMNELSNRCAPCGVAVVFVPELPRTASGATRWLAPDKALIQLSDRYKTDDQLWFTFFHEAAHVLSGGKRDLIIEGQSNNEAAEAAADKFAAEFLISSKDLRQFISGGPCSEVSIKHFAQHLGIAPGIVVGQLQHLNHLRWGSRLNQLKRTFDWS